MAQQRYIKLISSHRGIITIKVSKAGQDSPVLETVHSANLKQALAQANKFIKVLQRDQAIQDKWRHRYEEFHREIAFNRKKILSKLHQHNT
jgi:recombinational DNA repair ATPase RecF